jgi:hypothetical protein
MACLVDKRGTSPAEPEKVIARSIKGLYVAGLTVSIGWCVEESETISSTGAGERVCTDRKVLPNERDH